MATPGVHLITIKNPALYARAQLDRAAAIAGVLHRGQFVLCIQPEREGKA